MIFILIALPVTILLSADALARHARLAFRNAFLKVVVRSVLPAVQHEGQISLLDPSVADDDPSRVETFHEFLYHHRGRQYDVRLFRR